MGKDTLGEYFTPTLELRWRLREGDLDRPSGISPAVHGFDSGRGPLYYVLEQKWQGSEGNVKWMEIQVID